MTNLASPVSSVQRIAILDSLRGIAVLGILLMNVPIFGTSYTFHYNINLLREFSGPDYWSWFVVNLLFEGTMRGIFSMLFGAGALLLLDRLERNPELGINPADIFYRRQIWLFLFGMVNAFVFLWAGDILYTYGLVGLFLFPFRKINPKWMLGLGILFLGFATIQSSSQQWKSQKKRTEGEAVLSAQRHGKPLTDKQKTILETWNEYKMEHSVGHLRQEGNNEIAKIKNGSYADIQAYLSPINQEIQSEEMYHELFFDALSFFFIGMALFRFGFITGQKTMSTYVYTMLICYGIAVPLSYLRLHFNIITGFDYSRLDNNFSISVYHLRRVLMAIGHISFIMVVYKSGMANGLLRWLARVGQMAFTNYLTQSIICAVVFHGYGLAFYGKWSRFELYEYTFCLWVVQIVWSQIWLHYFRFGPFEWLWRSLTYWKRQPFLRQVESE